MTIRAPYPHLLALALTACAGAASDTQTAQVPGIPDANSLSSAKDYTKAAYPIVLAHGLFGWRTILGTVDYWYKIQDDLSSSGAQVFATEVTAAQSAETRGEQLLAQIEQIVAQTGAAKVNLVGHSQGGLDARYVMGVRPDLIASLTTVASPHLGADFADFLLDNTTPDGFGRKVIDVLGDGLGSVIDLISGKDLSQPQDIVAALDTLSATGSMAFNRKFPAGLASTSCGATVASNGTIPLFSWAGSSTITNPLDPIDLLLAATSLVYSDANDGLVGRCSAHFGKVLRDDYTMNHLDEVNQLLGLTSIFETSPVAVFRAQANRLKVAGL